MAQTVSVITRTRNRPHLLERMLRSLLAQKRQDWYWVVVDAGDAAATASLIARHADALAGRYEHLTVPPKSTIGAMSNTGLRAARGRFATLLDDDDTWETDFLEVMLAAAEGNTHPETAGVVCRTLCVEEEADEDGHYHVVKEYLHNPRLRTINLGVMAIVNQFCVHAFVYELRVLETVGFYDESLEVLDDWDFNLRFLMQYDIIFVPRPLARYHLRPKETNTPNINSQFLSACQHQDCEARIINRAIRADARGSGNGLGTLLALAAGQRDLLEVVKTTLRRVESSGRKIGRIDSRTKQIKDTRLR